MSILHDLSRAVDRHRRVLAGLTAALCVFVGVSTATSGGTPTTEVVVAAREIPAGATVAEADVSVRQVRTTDLPERVVTDPATVVGKVAGSGVARGSVLTELSVAGGSRLASGPGRVVVSVRVNDADVARLVGPGSRVVLLAPGAQGGLVSDDALVVALPQGTSGPLGGTGAQTVIVDVDQSAAEFLAQLPSGGVTLAIR